MQGTLEPTDTILIAEDDENDVLLLRRAFEKIGYTGRFRIVSDGEEALDYLQAKGKFADREKFPFPTLILTDLKMPKRNGFEILEWLGDHPECSVIPTIVFTSSPTDADVKKAYALGANSYFVKPPNFEDLQCVVRDLCNYWSMCRRPAVAKC